MKEQYLMYIQMFSFIKITIYCFGVGEHIVSQVDTVHVLVY